MAERQFDALYTGESGDKTTVDVYVPSIQVQITKVNISKTSGVDYNYNNKTLFTINVPDSVLKEVEDGAKSIDGQKYGVSGYERKQKSLNIAKVPLTPLVRAFEGIGEMVKAELQFCVANMKEYMDRAGKTLALASKNPKEERRADQQPKPGEIRFIPPVSNEAAAPVDGASTKTGSMTVKKEGGTDLQTGNGKGMDFGERGNTTQGTFKKPNPIEHSPVSPTGIDATTFPAKDCMPKGNVCTPHTSKLPDIMGYISLGIGIYNVLTVVRQLFGIEQRWEDTGYGYTKQDDNLLEKIKEGVAKAKANMDSAIPQPDMPADPMGNKIRKVKVAFGLLSPADVKSLAKGTFFKPTDDLYGASGGVSEIISKITG